MMELKVILAFILRKFEMKSLKTTEELEPLLELVLKPSNGIPVQLSLRRTSF
jgi:cytochrome P450